MPATPVRIGFILEEYRRASATDGEVTEKYGEKARKSDLVETFFEDGGDAQAMCDERLALLGADRRRFSHSLSGEDAALALDYTSASPTVTVIDDERMADHPALVSGIVLDFGKDQATIETWG